MTQFDTSNVSDMGEMFRDCSSLTSLDVTQFDTSNVSQMGYMFYGCSSLSSLDLRSFSTASFWDEGYYIFSHCSNLETVLLGKEFKGIDLSSVASDTKLTALISLCETPISIKDNRWPFGFAFSNNDITLYVLDDVVKAASEDISAYRNFLGTNKVKTIIEILGSNPVVLEDGATYSAEDDAGVTVAGFSTTNAIEKEKYEQYGFSLVTTGLPATVTFGNDKQVRYDLLDAAGNVVTTGIRTITSASPIQITKEPQDITVEKGEEATFEVEISNAAANYSWYQIKDGVTSALGGENASEIETEYRSSIQGISNGVATNIITIRAGKEGTLSFDYMVNSEKDGDLFTATISDANGTRTLLDGISGAVDWTNCSSEVVPTEEGTITLTLTYAKNTYVDVGADCAAIKNIKYEYEAVGESDARKIFSSFTDDDTFEFTRREWFIPTTEDEKQVEIWGTAMPYSLTDIEKDWAREMLANGETWYMGTKGPYNAGANETITIHNLDTNTVEISFEYKTVANAGFTFKYEDIADNTGDFQYYSKTETVDFNGNVEFYLYCTDSVVIRNLSVRILPKLETNVGSSIGFRALSTNDADKSWFEGPRVDFEKEQATLLAESEGIGYINGNYNDTTGLYNVASSNLILGELGTEPVPLQFEYFDSADGLSISIQDKTGTKEVALTPNVGTAFNTYQTTVTPMTSGSVIITMTYTVDSYVQGSEEFGIIKNVAAGSGKATRTSNMNNDAYFNFNVTNWSNAGYEGVNSSKLVIPATILDETYDGAKYYCIVSNVLGEVATRQATLTYISLLPMEGSAKISGTSKVGQTLTVDTSEINPSNAVFTYQWYSYDPENPTDDVLISGATSRTYKIESNQSGRVIYVVVKGTKDGYEDAAFRATMSEAVEALAIDEAKALITDWTIPAGGATIKLPIPGDSANDFLVDWGDGSDIELFSGTAADFPEHTYTNAAETTYTIKISGTVKEFGYIYNMAAINDIYRAPSSTNNYYTFTQYLTGVWQLGELSATRYGFSWCSNLATFTANATVNTFANVTDMTSMFSYCTSLTSLDVSSFNTSNVMDMKYMFYRCDSLTSLDVTHIDTSKVTNMSYMFYFCKSLTSLDVTHFDTSKVTTMRDMFSYCGSLTSLDVTHFDTSKVTNMYNMFNGCSSLTSLDVTHFDTSKVTNMTSMFDGCDSLTSLDVSGFDTSKVTSMDRMFAYCTWLTSLDVTHFDTSKVTNMQYMFYFCSSLTSLDVTHFDTSKVTVMYGMFEHCSSLRSLDVTHFDTSKVTNMRYMFAHCWSLTSLDVTHFDTSKVTNMQYMFYFCESLTSLDLSVFYTSNITNVGDMFWGCNNLQSILLGPDFTKLNGSNMFANCSDLTAIITLRDITSPDDAMELAAGTTTWLTYVRDAVLYVPNTTSETAYEAAENYSDVFGADRIRPILEISGDNPVILELNTIYDSTTDAGVSVAGFSSKRDSTNVVFTEYGFSVATSGLPVSTTTAGTKIVTYTLIKDGTAFVDRAIRQVNVGDVSETDVSEANDLIMDWKIPAGGATIKLPILGNSANDFLVDWGDGSDIEHFSTVNFPEHTYTNVEETTYTIKISGTMVTFGNTAYEPPLPSSDYYTFNYYLTKVYQLGATNTSQYSFAYCINLVEFDASINSDTSQVTVMTSMFNYCVSLISVDLSGCDTSNVMTMESMFSYCRSLTSIDLSNVSMPNVTTMVSMFSNCGSLTSIDLSNVSIPNVTTVQNMFSSCTALKTVNLSGLQAPRLAIISGMFSGCTALETINLSNATLNAVTSMQSLFKGFTNLKTANFRGFSAAELTSMEGMFQNCSNLTNVDFTGISVPKLTTMAGLFSSCTSLTSADFAGVSMPQLTTIGSMFTGCRALTSVNMSNASLNSLASMASLFSGLTNLETVNFSGFSGAALTNMGSMFYNCQKLTDVDFSGISVPNLTNIASMFYHCDSLTDLDLSSFNTARVTTMNNTFGMCTSLTSLDISGFSTASVTDMTTMFAGDSNLQSILLGPNFTKLTGSAMFGGCTSLRAIISLRDITVPSDSDPIQLAAGTTTWLTNVPDAVLYVPNATSEIAYEAATNYSDVLGADRIRPIIEVSGDNPVTLALNSTYDATIDVGATVAGFSAKTESSNAVFTKYGFSTTTSGLPVSTATSGNKFVRYRLSKNGTAISGGWASRKIIVGNVSEASDFITEWTIPSGGATIKLPIPGNAANNFSVDWGDGTVEGFTGTEDAFPGHTYTNAAETTYTIKISGTVKMFGDGRGPAYALGPSVYDPFNQYLTGVRQLGELSATQYAFSGCTNLTTFTANATENTFASVTNMANMFYNCSGLTNLDLSDFDTSNVTTMGSMFFGCTGLTSLDLSIFDTSNVTTMGGMFNSCSNLQSILLGPDFTKLTGSDMFENCSNLTAIITLRDITSPINAMELASGTTTGLKDLPNAVLYVPTPTSETAYEAATNYSDVFGADRIRPIIEVAGDNPVILELNSTYDATIDAGATVAGFSAKTETSNAVFTKYGFSTTTSGLPVSTTSAGNKTVTYTLSKDNTPISGATATRTVIVGRKLFSNLG